MISKRVLLTLLIGALAWTLGVGAGHMTTIEATASDAGPRNSVTQDVILAPDLKREPATDRGALVFRSLTPSGEVVIGRRDGMPGFTDAAFGLPPLPLNALELAKLDMARRAIEAAEAAGTQRIVPTRLSDLPVTIEDAESIKMQRLRTLAPRASTSHHTTSTPDASNSASVSLEGRSASTAIPKKREVNR